MKPILSVIIPCYNTEHTLEQTLRSVLDMQYDAWEAILVNDGSPDNLEQVALEWVKKDKRFRYFKKENGGLGSARNYGIEKALGDFILPLDSDNMVRPTFIKSALRIFEESNEIGVVYGNAAYFGERTGDWNVGAFDAFRLLAYNYIDACAIIRKEVFEAVGVYETNLPHQGHEDWELWLRVLASEYTFSYINEITFDYRVTNDSMIRSFDGEMNVSNENYIRQKHAALYTKYYAPLFRKYDTLVTETQKSVLDRFRRKIKKRKTK